MYASGSLGAVVLAGQGVSLGGGHAIRHACPSPLSARSSSCPYSPYRAPRGEIGERRLRTAVPTCSDSASEHGPTWPTHDNKGARA
ncbi:hypothetical protein TOK_0279 [Pseudonocardia sp. N23]|nr:hypothetical protein TOK_0279 [Pseudonocardia sp. N23]